RPFTAALWSLVPMAGTMAATPVTRALAHRLDRAYVAVAGVLLAGARFAGLTPGHVHSPVWVVLTPARLSAGGGLAGMSIRGELIMGAVPPERAGAAAAVAETAAEFGGALGIAVLGSIGTAAYRSSLAAAAPTGTPPAALGAARATLGGALTAAGRLPGRTGAGLAGAAPPASTPRPRARLRHAGARGPRARVPPRNPDEISDRRGPGRRACRRQGGRLTMPRRPRLHAAAAVAVRLVTWCR